MAGTVTYSATPPAHGKIQPNEIYSYRTDAVGLRIATGSSGVNKLLKTLAESYIRHCVETKGEVPFQVGWYSTHTHTSIEYLAANEVDLAITYHPFLEQVAVDMGVVDRVAYGWRDRWMLVGPPGNPAQLKDDLKQNIYRLFMDLYIKMEATKESHAPIQFLSPWDKSASNTKEQEIWTTIGLAPWVHKESSWYQKTPKASFDAVKLAAEKGLYTLTSYGVWCALNHEVGNKLKVFALGSEAESDPLFKPAHLCIATHGHFKSRATDFVNWISREDGGQAIVKSFKQNGVNPYTPAPYGFDPLTRVRDITKPKDVASVGLTTISPDYSSGSSNTSVTNGSSAVTVTSTTTINGTTSSTHTAINGDPNLIPDYVKLPIVGGGVQTTTGTEVTTTTVKETGATVTGCGNLTPATVAEHLPYEGTVWASVPNPTDKEVVWIFRDGYYVRYNVAQDKVLYGVKTIREGWPALYQYGFDAVDCVVPVTKHDTYAWFFYGRRCLLVDLNNGQAKPGERPFYWADRWPNLARTGWTRFDAAWPMFNRGDGSATPTIFFRGRESVETHLLGDQRTYEVKSVNDVSYVSFGKVGGTKLDPNKVDMIVSGNEWDRVWFVSGEKYTGKTMHDSNTWGPNNLKDYWPGLKSIGWV